MNDLNRLLSQAIYRGFLILFASAFVMVSFSSIVQGVDDIAKEEINTEDGDRAGYGSVLGETGIYYKHVDYKKDSFIEDGEITDLDDSDLIVPYIQVEYISPEFLNSSIGASLIGYARFDGELNDEMDGHDHFVVHRLFLKYNISDTFLKVGRQELEDALLLTDYYEALSITSEEINDFLFIFALVKSYADSDPDEFIEFQNISRGNRTVDDYLYALEVTWDVIPDAIVSTLYFHHQGNLYDLYGMHLQLFHETEKIGFGILADYYATDEDSSNGLRDAGDVVRNSYIYHVNPFIEVDNAVVSGGYISGDQDVGAREGDLIDDYFNPLNEGDKVYEPDAKTWYGAVSYESEGFNIELVLGRTDYFDDTQRLTEEEFNINAGLRFWDNFRVEAEFGVISSESAEGDFTILETKLSYQF